MELKSGTLLQGGKYRIEKALGQGTFGITYLGTHTALDRKVAIKEFFMQDVNDRDEDGSTIIAMTEGSLSYNYAQKFRKEAKNLSTLEHPNIVRVMDCFDENGTYYYVMDYIEGENLNDYVKHAQLSEAEAVSIIKDVASALDYMHNVMHMLHLDLKPGNIMRRYSDGHIFLIDFGLSKHFDKNGQPETSTSVGLGTPGFAPMEQGSQTMNGEFRPTIDVYALGATLYKLLTRQTPPEASVVLNDDEVIETTLKRCGVSAVVTQAVVKSMMPIVKYRTQTVANFMASLNAPQVSPVVSDNAEKTRFEVAEDATMVETPVQAPVQTKQEAVQVPVTPPIEEQPEPAEVTVPVGKNEKKGKSKLWILLIVIAVVAIIAIVVGVTTCNRSSASSEASDSTMVSASATLVAPTPTGDPEQDANSLIDYSLQELNKCKTVDEFEHFGTEFQKLSEQFAEFYKDKPENSKYEEAVATAYIKADLEKKVEEKAAKLAQDIDSK